LKIDYDKVQGGNLKKVGVVYGYIKKSKGFPMILAFFWDFLELVFIEKVMD
jgi:hypothetical protein